MDLGEAKQGFQLFGDVSKIKKKSMNKGSRQKVLKSKFQIFSYQ